MANVGLIYYRVIDTNSGGYLSSDNIKTIYDDNIVTQYNATKFTKLGVLAPPGTRMIINDNKSIMVGRTGIYELDDNITITSLKFVRPKKYLKNEEKSAEAKANGIKGMEDANTNRLDKLDKLDKNPEVFGDAYWEQYNEIQADYIEEYYAALNLYNTGNNGIYELIDPGDPESELNYDDLYNIIVDFLYE